MKLGLEMVIGIGMRWWLGQGLELEMELILELSLKWYWLYELDVDYHYNQNKTIRDMVRFGMELNLRKVV